MALWRDPLDELIDELDLVVPPASSSTRRWNVHEYPTLLSEAQAEVAAIAFSVRPPSPRRNRSYCRRRLRIQTARSIACGATCA